ncbi:helicase HerA-like domain-containing protein [Thalassoroseus pseudoceratinae]|uniref:helicase HerA-like domain-containing protein n=1 Tax=Thalassoroseus pseudoceratinae TaxID=2713176 RepID=UPI0019815825|nr:helicase HerA-like domain-containing protein [Thalassoroseus pseudoceratinae]
MSVSSYSVPVKRKPSPTDEERRATVFCSASGPVIFRAVAHPTEVWTPDPFDVESIHEPARDVFVRLLDRATSADETNKVGRILLLKGESGSGKTHLMRAFRTHTHRRGLGYFGYMQMTSASNNYSRYMLHKLVDSLDKPYYRAVDAPDETTGLLRLAEAVTESPCIPPSDLELLRQNSLNQRKRNELIEDLADELLGDPRFAGDEKLQDLLRAMFLLQCGHAGVRARVMKYLRGETLGASDQERLAGISPLDPEAGPQEMLQRLGRLMWAAHGMSLVLCVDQLEDMYRADQSAEAANRFRRAMQGLISIAAEVPTSIMVVACLEDYYTQLRNLLDSSYQDRIESDPSPVTLVAKRSSEEISQLVGAHLNHLYDETETSFDESAPTSPIPQVCLDQQVGQRTRSVLEWCRSYRNSCIAAGRILEECHPDSPGHDDGEDTLFDLEQEWNDFLAQEQPSPPDDEAELATLLESTVHYYEDELPESHRFDSYSRGQILGIVWARNDKPAQRLQVGICNKAPQGGWLGRQVKEVSRAAQDQEPEAIPVIVRSTNFPKSPTSQISKQLGQLVAKGGRRVVVQDTDWRTMLAMQSFRKQHHADPQFSTWLAETKPLSQLKSIRDIFGIDGSFSFDEPESEADNTVEAAESVPESSNEHAEGNGQVESAKLTLPTQQTGTELAIGQIRARNAEAITLKPNALKRHAAFLGGTGSGKTTAALNLIEQLLLQGVPALLVDRKGDLARYATEDVWNKPPSDPALAERLQRLKESVNVTVYTPGRIDGRPITLTVVPEHMQDMNAADRQQTALQAAHSLAAMLGYGTTGANGSRTAILVKAIELLAQEDGRVTLQSLIHYLDESDPGLVNAIGVLKPKLFDKLVEDLQTLKINRSNLFPDQGDPLDGDALFGSNSHHRPGKTQLSVISTKFLGSDAEVQFWVSQLLMELSRWMSKTPSDDLQAVVLFDEADLYLPATSKPVTKEPMEGLLKRARSAGVGLMLATQSPGDFDYKCRENINTWFVGKIKEDTAIKKMKPMLSDCQLDVSDKLTSQEIGQFFIVRDGHVTPVQSLRSAVETEQLPEDEILQLARQH